jgi:membrane protein DedA with SNARE-associated domain
MKDCFDSIFQAIDPFFVSEWRFLLVTGMLFFLCSSVLVPPSEPLAASSGAVLARYDHHLAIFLIIAVVSYHLGSCLWHVSGKRSRRARAAHAGQEGEPPLPARLLGKFYHATLKRVERGLEIDGGKLFVILRNVPLIRSVVSFPAGAAGFSGMQFHVSSLAGISVWVTLWSVAGFLFGKSIDRFAPPVVIGGFILFCIAAYFYSRNLGRRFLTESS